MKKTTIILLLLPFLVVAQGKNELQNVRNEIAKLEKELQSKSRKEQSLMEQVEDVNREIGLRRKLIQELDSEKKKTEGEISATQKFLSKISRNHNQLQKAVSKRIVSLYKQGSGSDWEAMLSLQSFNQVSVFLKYKKLIVENDRRNLRLIRVKQLEIEKQKKQLENRLNEKKKLIGEKKTESSKLEKKKKSRETILVSVKKDKKLIEETLRKKRAAYREVQARISKEEEKRKKGESIVQISGAGFLRKKGKMIWPVSGKVITKHGRHLHPVLKTWTENLGVDIRGRELVPVSCVCNGVVRWVTWQRGMGNLVLMDHGEGYYTVYGYLDEVFVSSGEKIDEGDAIGRVGDKKSLYGSDLHFQVWNTDFHYNPEEWLRKQ